MIPYDDYIWLTMIHSKKRAPVHGYRGAIFLRKWIRGKIANVITWENTFELYNLFKY